MQPCPGAAPVQEGTTCKQAGSVPVGRAQPLADLRRHSRQVSILRTAPRAAAELDGARQQLEPLPSLWRLVIRSIDKWLGVEIPLPVSGRLRRRFERAWIQQNHGIALPRRLHFRQVVQIRVCRHLPDVCL